MRKHNGTIHIISLLIISIGVFGVLQSLFVFSDDIQLPINFCGIIFIDRCKFTARFELISILLILVGIKSINLQNKI
jgi:hypothetical protein